MMGFIGFGIMLVAVIAMGAVIVTAITNFDDAVEDELVCF